MTKEIMPPLDHATAALVAAQLTHAMAVAGGLPGGGRKEVYEEFLAFFDDVHAGTYRRIPG